MRQALGPGALGRPRGSRWRGRWEGGSGWGTHVNPWLFHFSVWQNSLQIKKNKKAKKKKKKNASSELLKEHNQCRGEKRLHRLGVDVKGIRPSKEFRNRKVPLRDPWEDYILRSDIQQWKGRGINKYHTIFKLVEGENSLEQCSGS